MFVSPGGFLAGRRGHNGPLLVYEGFLIRPSLRSGYSLRDILNLIYSFDIKYLSINIRILISIWKYIQKNNSILNFKSFAVKTLIGKALWYSLMVYHRKVSSIALGKASFGRCARFRNLTYWIFYSYYN